MKADHELVILTMLRLAVFATYCFDDCSGILGDQSLDWSVLYRSTTLKRQT